MEESNVFDALIEAREETRRCKRREESLRTEVERLHKERDELKKSQLQARTEIGQGLIRQKNLSRKNAELKQAIREAVDRYKEWLGCTDVVLSESDLNGFLQIANSLAKLVED